MYELDPTQPISSVSSAGRLARARAKYIIDDSNRSERIEAARQKETSDRIAAIRKEFPHLNNTQIVDMIMKERMDKQALDRQEAVAGRQGEHPITTLYGEIKAPEGLKTNTNCQVIGAIERSTKEHALTGPAVPTDFTAVDMDPHEAAENVLDELARRVIQKQLFSSRESLKEDKFSENPLIKQYWDDSGEFKGHRLSAACPARFLQMERWLQEFLIDYDATRAALAAGFGPDRTRARHMGTVIRSELRRIITARTSTIAGRCGVTAEAVIRELAKIGFSNIGDFINDDNSVRKLKSLSPDKLAAVSEITVKERRFGDDDENPLIETKLKFHDKQTALKTLAGNLKIDGGTDAVQTQAAPAITIVLNTGSSTKEVVSNVLPDDGQGPYLDQGQESYDGQ